HFDGRPTRLIASVTAIIGSRATRPGLGLFFSVRREDTEDDRNPIVVCDARDPQADSGADIFKVRSLSTNHRTQTHHRVIAAGLGQASGDQWYFKGAGNRDHLNRIVFRPAGAQRFQGALKEPFRHSLIKTALNDGKSEVRGGAAAINYCSHRCEKATAANRAKVPYDFAGDLVRLI